MLALVNAYSPEMNGEGRTDLGALRLTRCCPITAGICSGLTDSRKPARHTRPGITFR